MPWVGQGNVIPFGYVPQNTGYTFYLPITNTGTVNLVITGVTITPITSSPGDFTTLFDSGTVTITPGSTNTGIGVTFMPTAAYETFESATIKFTSNALGGLQQFTLTGTCVNPGTDSSVTVGSTTASASHTGTGTSTTTSSSLIFPSDAVGTSAEVSVIVNVTYSTPGGTSTGLITFNYSTNSGSSWTTFFSWYGAITPGGATGVNENFTIPSGVVTNTSLVELQVIATVTTNGGSSTAVGTINSATAYVTTGGADIFCQVIQLNASAVQIPPVMYFGNVTVGVTTNYPNTFNIVNTSNSVILVEPYNDYAAGYNFQFTPDSNLLTPGEMFSLTNITLTAPVGGNQDDTSAISITIASQVGAINIEGLYNALSLTPVYSLTDSTEQMLIGLFDGSNISTMMQVLPTNLACEEACNAITQLDFEAPDLNKQLERLLLRYEALGACVVAITYSAISPTGQVAVTQTRTLSTSTDGKLRQTLFDGSIAGDIISISINIAAAAGPFSMTLYAPYFEPRGEIIETQ